MRAAEDSLWWYSGMRHIAATLLRGRLIGARVLDVGCGTGANLVWLGDAGAEALGVDASPLAIAGCVARQLRAVARGSADALPFPEASFDGVMCLDVLYHTRVRDDVGALREIGRVLRPGGWALLRVPAIAALYGQHDVAVHGRQRYSRSELRGKIAASGLRLERLTGANVLLLPLAAAARLWRRHFPRVGSAVSPPPRPVNAALAATFRVEAAIVSRWNLPTGLSLMAVARRPG